MTSTGKNVPRIEPRVESELFEPAVFPALPTPFTLSRIAKGETQPSKIRGIEKSRMIPASEPKNNPPSTFRKPSLDHCKIGLLSTGISPIAKAAQAVNW